LRTDAVTNVFSVVPHFKIEFRVDKGAAMISPFSRMTDYAVDSHFRKDRSGRLVFVPFSLKRKCYFVDSKSDEEKIRALVRMYRSAFQLISFLTSPSIFVPAFILDDYAGLSPRGHRLAIAFGIPLYFWLVLVALLSMLWSLYKGAIPSLTASLIEVGPDLKGQLRQISQRPWRLPLLFAAAGLLVMILALFAIMTGFHFHR
jgi:hypothetical protein